MEERYELVEELPNYAVGEVFIRTTTETCVARRLRRQGDNINWQKHLKELEEKTKG